MKDLLELVFSCQEELLLWLWLYRYHWSVVIAVCYMDLQDHLKEGTGRVCQRLQQIEFGERKYPKNSRHGPRVCLVIYCFHR